jgi:hypothetical protein
MKRRMVGRREAIKQTLAWCIGAAAGGSLLSACGPGDPPPPCEPGYDDQAIGWGPNVLAPVFYGYADYNPSVGAPANLRVYYPSLDGSPPCAPFLTGPGHFPLVLFLHGACGAAELHYTRWSRLPAVLARSGFVVAIPDLTGIGYAWDFNNATYEIIGKVMDWMRTTWSHSKYLMEPPILGIVGHSYGALHGAHLALTIPATAFVSLGGVWNDWPSVPPPNPLNQLTIPKLIARGTGATQEGLNYNAVPAPKHRLVFPNGTHWDYVPPEATSCDAADGSKAGPCDLVADLAADFTAVFLSKYMGPEESHGALSNAIPDNLTLPSVKLTQKQMFFAGNHLASFGLIGAHKGCSVTLDWVTSGGSGSRTLP